MSTKPQKIVIIGGGIIGLCIAYYAAKKGYEILVLERSKPDHQGCSFGNAGLIVPSHIVPLAAPGAIAKGLRWLINPESPFYIKPSLNWSLIRWMMRFWMHSNESHVRTCADLLAQLNLESRQLYNDLSEDNEIGLKKRGLLMLCKTQQSLDEESATADLANKLGMQTEVCSSSRLKELDPSVEMDVCGGVWFKQDCHLHPHRLMEALRKRILENGGSIRYGADVRKFEYANAAISRAILADGEAIEGDHFALAGGSWSNQLSRTIGLNLPLQAGKGYSLTLSEPPQLPTFSSILVEAKVAVTPMGPSLRFSGTMEVGAADTRINPRRIQGIIKSASSYLPQFHHEDFRNVTPWAGLRPCSPDGLPYVGRSPRFRNLAIATGHAMMGLSLGPVTGKLVADLITGDGHPDVRLSPCRFKPAFLTNVSICSRSLK